MQYQFILDDLKESDQIQSELEQVGIDENDIHFVSENSKDFAGHQVHEASIIEERDVLHSGMRWAVVGFLSGLLLALVIGLIQPYGWQPQLINTLLFCLLGMGFGGWMGGLVGMSHRNYRISQYEEQLQQGKALMLVYTDEAHAKPMREIMSNQHPTSEYLGAEAHYDNPLTTKKLAELED